MTEPSYRRVARELREQVTGGRYGDGGRLPTEAELAVSYGVSRQTIRRAFQDLVAEGLVGRTRGRGTFARPPGDLYVRQMGSIDDLMGLSDDTTMIVLRPLTRQVDVAAAGRLGLSTDVVHRLDLARLHGGIRFCTTSVVLPPSAAALLADAPPLSTAGTVGDATVIGLLDRRLPAPITEARQSITVAPATPTVAADLSCPEGHPTLRIDRLYLDTHAHPVELAISHFLPEHYSYRTHLRRTR